MHKPSSYKNTNQRSDIRFARAVAAPKFNHPPAKPLTQTNLWSGHARMQQPLPNPYTLVISLSLED